MPPSFKVVCSKQRCRRISSSSFLFFFPSPIQVFFWGCWCTSSISRHTKQLHMLRRYKPGRWGRMRWERDMMQSVIPVQGCRQHAVLPGTRAYTAGECCTPRCWLAGSASGWMNPAARSHGGDQDCGPPRSPGELFASWAQGSVHLAWTTNNPPSCLPAPVVLICPVGTAVCGFYFNFTWLWSSG